MPRARARSSRACVPRSRAAGEPARARAAHRRQPAIPDRAPRYPLHEGGPATSSAMGRGRSAEVSTMHAIRFRWPVQWSAINAENPAPSGHETSIATASDPRSRQAFHAARRESPPPRPSLVRGRPPAALRSFSVPTRGEAPAMAHEIVSGVCDATQPGGWLLQARIVNLIQWLD